MKKTKFIQFVLVFALLAFYVLPVSAQSLYVRNTNETQSVYSLSTISKITFSGGNVIVHKTDNSTVTHAISEIRYMSFSDYVDIFMPREQEDVLTVSKSCK